MGSNQQNNPSITPDVKRTLPNGFFRVDHITILQDLSKEERLLEIRVIASRSIVHVSNAREPRADSRGVIDGYKSLPCPLPDALARSRGSDMGPNSPLGTSSRP